MAVAWDNYIYNVHKAIPLDPWSNDLEVLDILIKKGSTGFQRRPVVARVGSIVTVGREDVDSWASDRERIREGLKLLRVQKFDSELSDDFLRGRQANIKVCLKASSSFVAGILGGSYAHLQARFHNDTVLDCTINDVSFRKVDVDFLMELICQGFWKPNITKPQLQWTKQTNSYGGRDLWVVTEIKYAEKIIIGKSNTRGVGGSITIPLVDAVASSHVGPQLKILKENDDTWAVTAPENQPFPFAFKGIRLRYNANGELCPGGIESDIGGRRLVKRTGLETMFDVDNNLVYHLGEFFTKSQSESAGIETDEGDLQHLDLIDETSPVDDG